MMELANVAKTAIRIIAAMTTWSSVIQFADNIARSNVQQSVFFLGIFILSFSMSIAIMEKLDGQERADEGNRPVR